MLFLNLKLKQTSGIMRLRHPPRVAKTICSFCSERWKRDDGTPLLPVSQELTYWHFLFPIYCCDECAGDGKLTYLIEIMEMIRLLENFNVCINFDGHTIVNPSDVYIPFTNSSSGDLQFFCMREKCSMKICCDTGSRETDLFHKSTIHGCVINPSSGEIKTESVSIAQIIFGVNLLNRILRGEFPCSYIKAICEFDSQFSEVSPRIPNFSITDPNSILKLFSLIVSGIYSDDAINAVLNGEMKEQFLKFITDSMISMTAFMRQNGLNDKLPELKEAPVIPEFLTKNYGRAGFSFTHQDIICQNFRNFLKLFRKILRYLSYVNDSSHSIDLFQYCRFLYATLHVGNQQIYHRFTRQIPPQKMSRYFEYLERYVMPESPFCVEIFATVPASETKLDKCAICWTDDSATVIGRCPQHNICCLDCFPRVVQNQKSCPTCRSPDFLP
jgi:hypothetical protein